MSAVFLKLVNMSIAAGWLILAVVLLRALLKKAPKALRCALWALVAVRLLCPVSLESAWSLVPRAEALPRELFDTVEAAAPPAPAAPADAATAPRTPAAPGAGTLARLAGRYGPAVWLCGMAALLLYALVSYLRLRRRVAAALPLKAGVWLCDDVRSPFILGVLRPRIYLPSDMEEEQVGCVLAHENAHLQRRDHLWKPLGFALLTVYWFNPLCWLAYALLCRDIELACDERVVRDLDPAGRKAYSSALLSCSAPRTTVAACPLAFGEVGVKERIGNVLNYKKPAFWLILVAVLACAVAGVCFLTDPKNDLSAADALSQLEGSVEKTENMVSFTLPQDYPNVENWQIQVSARVAYEDGFTRSVHYFEDEEWTAGKRYDVPVDDTILELTLAAALPDDSGSLLERTIALVSTEIAEKVPLTLENVLTLAQKGDALTWADFARYSCIETGSGLYILVYDIDEDFSLWIGGVPGETPMYIRLVTNADQDVYADIRTEDPAAFIAAHRSPAPVTLAVVPATDELLGAYAAYNEYADATDEYSQRLLITADAALRELRFLELTWSEEQQDIVPVEGAALYSADELTPDRPLLLQTSLPSTMPTRGFSFVDGKGVTRYFYLSESGEDGSFFLAEFWPTAE